MIGLLAAATYTQPTQPTQNNHPPQPVPSTSNSKSPRSTIRSACNRGEVAQGVHACVAYARLLLGQIPSNDNEVRWALTKGCNRNYKESDLGYRLSPVGCQTGTKMSRGDSLRAYRDACKTGDKRACGFESVIKRYFIQTTQRCQEKKRGCNDAAQAARHGLGVTQNIPRAVALARIACQQPRCSPMQPAV